MELHQWVLAYVEGVFLPLSDPNGFLPPPSLVALVQSSNLGLQEKVLELLFWCCRVASILQIVEGSREIAPFSLVWLSYLAPLLILAHCAHLVSLYLLVIMHNAP